MTAAADPGSIPFLVGTGAAILFLLICSALFSGSETALTTANRGKLHKRAEKGDLSARRALRLSALQPHIYPQPNAGEMTGGGSLASSAPNSRGLAQCFCRSLITVDGVHTIYVNMCQGKACGSGLTVACKSRRLWP